MHESIYEVDENCKEQETGEHPCDLKLQVRQQGLVVKYLGVQVVREHEGQVEIAGDCNLIHKGYDVLSSAFVGTRCQYEILPDY